MSLSKEQLLKLNKRFQKADPKELISWALQLGNKSVITTNFRPYEVAILHVVTSVHADIPVIWCDTGYNTPNTYKHAEEVIQRLRLNIQLYVPKQTAAYRDSIMGIPDVDTKAHQIFTEQVKLEPFKRAMNDHQPDVWFTNLRAGQTSLRDSLDILSYDAKGILKVSPFYHYDDNALDAYLAKYGLPNEQHYFDPTKVHENRECGLHTP